MLCSIISGSIGEEILKTSVSHTFISKLDMGPMRMLKRLDRRGVVKFETVKLHLNYYLKLKILCFLLCNKTSLSFQIFALCLYHTENP